MDKEIMELTKKIKRLHEYTKHLEQQLKKKDEVIDKLSIIIYEIKDCIESAGGYPSEYIDNLLQILEDKEAEYMTYREKIRKAIDCPQFSGNNYGEWGALRFEQRLLIKRLLDDLDNTEECVKRFYEKNQQLKIQISAREEECRKLENNWNELKNWLEEQKNYLTEIDGRHIPLNDGFEFCSMNELYQTGKYSGLKDILSKMQELEGKSK